MGSKYTEAQARASKKYEEKIDVIYVRIPKGKKEIYKKCADSFGLSLNQYIIHCLEKGMN